MRVTGFVDRGIPKVRIHWNGRIGIILTLRQYAEMKSGSPLGREVNRALEKTISDVSRVTHVIAGGK